MNQTQTTSPSTPNSPTTFRFPEEEVKRDALARGLLDLILDLASTLPPPEDDRLLEYAGHFLLERVRPTYWK